MTEADLYALGARAKAGEAAAQHELGVKLMLGREVSLSLRGGTQLIEAAARQGFAPALRLAAVLNAVGFERPADWDAALSLLAQAAWSDGAARAEVDALGADFSIAHFVQPPPARLVREAPRIAVLEKFLPARMCDWIIARARTQLVTTRVYNPGGGQTEAARRTNSGAGFRLAESDLVLKAVEARIAAAVGLPLAQQEPINVLHYAPGQEFLPHFDALNPSIAAFARDLEVNGQRVLTFLIYLNDDFEGGETDFPRLGWCYRGAKGDALLFWNVRPDGAWDEQTLHAGLATTRGEKWLLSKWIRDKALPLR